MRDATAPGRLGYAWAIGVGMKVAERRLQGRRPGLALTLLHRLADLLVLDNVKRSLGLHRARAAATGAAPIAPDLNQVVHGAGHRHAGGVRADGELWARHGHAGPPHQARHRRRGPARHRGEDLRGR